MPRCLTINLGSAFSAVNPFKRVGGTCSLSHSVCPLAGFPGLQEMCQWGEKVRNHEKPRNQPYMTPPPSICPKFFFSKKTVKIVMK